jgi:carbon monoxide dehydrogenase subunit G
MARWEFKHSAYTNAKRKDVWNYWSNMDNHAKMEPGVDRIELDGPFETGTTGRTITKYYTQELELSEVSAGNHYTIIGKTPDSMGFLSFTWSFEDAGKGTRMTEKIKAEGTKVEEYLDEFRQMEKGAVIGMVRLVEELDRLTKTEWNKE